MGHRQLKEKSLIFFHHRVIFTSALYFGLFVGFDFLCFLNSSNYLFLLENQTKKFKFMNHATKVYCDMK